VCLSLRTYQTQTLIVTLTLSKYMRFCSVRKFMKTSRRQIVTCIALHARQQAAAPYHRRRPSRSTGRSVGTQRTIAWHEVSAHSSRIRRPAGVKGVSVGHVLRLRLDRDPSVARIDMAMVVDGAQSGRLERTSSPSVDPVDVLVNGVERARANARPCSLPHITLHYQ